MILRQLFPYFVSLLLLYHAPAANAEGLSLADSALAQLHFSAADFYAPLIATQALPFDPTMSVVILPILADTGAEMFSLDSYILLVSNKTGKIISRYFEDHTTNGWESDAIRLTSIDIDTASYRLAPGLHAFTVRVTFEGMSRPNPYNSVVWSLFVQKNDSLQCVLERYEMGNYHGEWDTKCAGASTSEDKVLKVLHHRTNGLSDLLITNTITSATTTLVADDCKEISKKRTRKTVLKFQAGRYR